MLYLTEDEVERLLPMGDALRVVEEALGALGRGEATNRPRERVRSPGGVLNVMPAGWPARGYFGFKYYTGSRDASRFWFQLFSAHSGEPVAAMQADRLGQRRTGAATGVATKYLARPDASVVGIIGTGWQAESQLLGVAAVRHLKEVRAFGRDAAKCKTFAREAGTLLGLEVRPVDTAEAAVRDADIVITATTSKDPVVHGAWLKPGAHVNAIGSNRIESRELDDDVIRRASLIMTDSREQAHNEAGDLVDPITRNLLSWEQVREIGDLVAGKVSGRASPEQITVFKSLGIGLEDVAAGAWVYERAKDRGFGREIEW